MNFNEEINQLLVYALIKYNNFEIAKYCRYNGATNIPYVIGLIVNNYRYYFDNNKEEMTKWLRMLNGIDNC